MPIKSPFETDVAKAGHGEVILDLLPPSIPTLTTLTYKYPLKLLARTPGFVPRTSAQTCPSRPVHLYLLTYGGGLLPGDHIDVSITLKERTRMVVSTPQGSTKIFKTEPTASVKGQRGTPAHIATDMSRQMLDVRIDNEAAICYLPDPAVPYKDSRYEQAQTFTVDGTAPDSKRGSLCVLDWVTEGRSSRGETWDFHFWKGKNEVWSDDGSGSKKLLLRDSIILDDECDDAERDADNSHPNMIRERTHPHGIVGTLILYGPVYEKLASFILHRFTTQPRIGARNWSTSVSPAKSATESYSNTTNTNATWTAARVRAGFTLVKFGAPDFEAAKTWLGDLLREEGSVVREFGEEALICL
ncbi:urease accessory protein UreD [Aspergillus ruber CBS 135680]|uniref:Urease accessory protein UreD n=1 Tax=Aspergillus ruber (strain CBS 135680) TaxID=1388766 RepID=A0A017SI25_ASPRC|nr:urease accessory protein UreD [Aspergillus ruber CBS 135680]EYE96602.1 urease accessory protein UreD [Aspergillus ruber CBS 135680]